MMDSEAYIYLFYADTIRRFKILASRESYVRNQVVSDRFPYPVKVVEFFPSSRSQQDEAQLHQMLSSHRIQGDWFEFESPQSAIAPIREYFRIREEMEQQLNSLSQNYNAIAKKLKKAEEKNLQLEGEIKRLQAERDRLFQYKITIQRDLTRFLSRMDSHEHNGNSIYAEQSLRSDAIRHIRHNLGCVTQGRRLQRGDTVIMIGFSLFEYREKFEQLKACLERCSLTSAEDESEAVDISAGVPVGIYFTTDKPIARLEVEVPNRYWSLPGMLPELFAEVKTLGFEARFCRLVHLKEEGDTGELGFIPCEKSEDLWQEILANVKPLGTQTLLRQQGTLLELSPDETRIGVTSRTLLKMIQDKIPNLEQALERSLGIRCCVRVELIGEGSSSGSASGVPHTDT
ncbi:MAG: GIY-YIG nuclease family protein [Limnospira sp.]